MSAYKDKNSARTADVISLYKMGSPAIDSVTEKEVKALSIASYSIQKESLKAVLAMQLIEFSAAGKNNVLTVKVSINGVFKTLKTYNLEDYYEDLVVYVKAGDKIQYSFELVNDNTGSGQTIKDRVDLDARVLLIIDSEENCKC